MAFLIRTLRESQQLLSKFLSAATRYNLTNEEKDFLLTMAQGNATIEAEIEDQIPNLFQRVDTNGDFNEWQKEIEDSPITRSICLTLPYSDVSITL